MNPIITDIFLEQNSIINLKKNISENAVNPLIDGIANSRVVYTVARCSTYSPYFLGDDSFDFLKDMIDTKVRDILQEDLDVLNWWVMKYKGNDHTDEHDHRPFARWVAIYYIDAPSGSGELYFPHINVTIKPETGMLVIHSADLVHGVRKNSSPDIERYNMVINYK